MPQASSVTAVLTTFSYVLRSPVRYQSTHARPSKIYLFMHFLISVIPHKIKKVFKNPRSNDLQANSFAAHYVICAVII